MSRIMMRVRWASIAIILSLAVLGTAPKASQADPLALLIAGELLRTSNVSACIGLHSRGQVIMQTSEVTCGPAALATLLRFYYGEDCTEAEITELAGTFKKGTTTMLGLRDACQSMGYEAIGYRMTLPQLLQEVNRSQVPVLIHFKEPTLHYALVTGAVGDYILVSDPAWGEISMHKDDFLRRWSGKALVVRSSRAANTELVNNRRSAAKIRLNSLNMAGRMMSSF